MYRLIVGNILLTSINNYPVCHKQPHLS